jgi:holo-[acyl-carrier protein] synthase
MDDIGMELFEGDEGEVVSAEGGLEAAAIFEDVFARVPIGQAEIQDFFTVKIANAAGAGAEAMDQPGELLKRRNLKDSQAAKRALSPIVGIESAAAPFADTVLCPDCFRRSHNSTSIIGLQCLAEREGAGGFLIIGMGVDIAEVERIQGAIERHGEVFLRRVYTEREREYCEQFKNKYERYAGRFAAKEAAMKALGTGWRRGVRWVDLEVVRETSGRPTLAILGEAAKIAAQLGVKSVALSITHTESQALAQVIFEG